MELWNTLKTQWHGEGIFSDAAISRSFIRLQNVWCSNLIIVALSGCFSYFTLFLITHHSPSHPRSRFVSNSGGFHCEKVRQFTNLGSVFFSGYSGFHTHTRTDHLDVNNIDRGVILIILILWSVVTVTADVTSRAIFFWAPETILFSWDWSRYPWRPIVQ